MSGSERSKPDEMPSAYAGRWVARLHGQVIAQGGTPEQARLAGRSSRHKEAPEIVFMPPEHPLSLSPLVEAVRKALPPEATIHLVGGAVRDALLGRTTHDLDFIAPSGGIRIARQVAKALKADFFALDPERDTGRVIVTTSAARRSLLDFAAYRGPDLEADLRDRDFTINALAYDLRTQTILDPLNGAADLREKRIRACTPQALANDPVRILRAVRLAASLNFQIEKQTRQAMKQALGGLDRVSPERLRDELFRTLEGPQPDASIRALEVIGALPHILPELSAMKGVEQPLPHIYEVWTHTLSVLGHLESLLAVLAPGYDPEETADLFTGLLTLRLGRYRPQFAAHFAAPLNADRSTRALLFFAALYHDVAKPHTRSSDESGKVRFWGHDELGAKMAARRAHALNLSNAEIHRLRTVIRHHMRFHFHSNRLEGKGQPPSRRAIYRFFRDAGEAGVDLVLLGLADLRATHGHALTQETWVAGLDVARVFLENYWEKPAETVAPPPLLDGHDLMRALDLQPGPRVGELLEAIREAQATGKVGTRQQALALARERIAASNDE